MTTPLARRDVERFREIIGKRLGLFFEDAKFDYLEGVARQRLEACGGERFDAYLRRVAASDGPEISALAEQLTVGETYFFRYWDHFRAFSEVVLPERVNGRGHLRKLRVLSAGCASGEEAYSLAILLRERLADFASYDLDLLGVDINPIVVEKARRAQYSAWSLREAPPDLSKRYFRHTGRDFELDPNVRSMVSFQEQNLVDRGGVLESEAGFDVIFCRNVTMYFTPEMTRRVIDRISRALVPGGFLFLGHAETLRGVSHAFHLRHTHDTFYYQLREGHLGPIVELPARDARVMPPSDLPARAVTADSDISWVEAIQRASDRIAALARPTQPGDVPDHSPCTTQSWDLGPVVDMLRQERFVDALELLRALPAASTSDPDAELLRAVLLTNSGELAAAEQVCEHILSVDDLSAGAHYLMALCRDHAGDLDGAVEHDLAATYLDGSFVMPHMHLGLLARRRGDLERARHALRRTLTLLPREDASRIVLFGGGFSREALGALCRAELHACGGES